MVRLHSLRCTREQGEEIENVSRGEAEKGEERVRETEKEREELPSGGRG